MLPNYKNILYCTQVGRNSPYVFRHALSLARKLEARIVVLHVMETLSVEQEALVEGYVGKGKLHAVVEHEEHEAVDRLRKRIEVHCEREFGEPGCEGLVEEIIIAEGHKDQQILAHVEKVGADLVVMGAHAESSLLEAVLGSTAQKVIRRCPVPVVVVQVPEDMQDPEISRI